jgi:hypothetical protein
MLIETKRLISPAQAADEIQVSVARILQLVRADALPSIPIFAGPGRKSWRVFRIEDVQRYAKERKARGGR